MTMKKLTRAALLAWIAGLVGACASTTVTVVHRAADFDPGRIRKALVVSISTTPGVGRLLEHEFVRQWKARGVEAAASSDVLPPGVALDKANVAAAAKTQGFDTVLVTRLLKREKIEPKIAHPNSELAPPPPNDTDSNLSQYVQASVASPEYAITYEVAAVTVNLYDVATEKKLWSGATQTIITGDIPKILRPFTKAVLKNLYK